MNNKIFINVFMVLLTVTFVVPAALFIAPREASAAQSAGGCVVGLAAGLAGVTANKVIAVPTADAAGGAGSWTTAGSTVGSCIYNLIVVPVLRQMIRTMLQDMTKATINWINNTPGTGQPSFVQNLALHMQQIGDAAAKSFVKQIAQTAIGAGLKNPYFGPAISLALMNNYQRQTTLAGFFATYACTLARNSLYPDKFLKGNWSQGGAGAWFALTTQPNNNPFMVYQAAQSVMLSQVTQAQTNTRQDLSQSGGFLSYCPGNTTSSTAADTIANWCSNCKGAGGTCDLKTNECIDPTGGKSAATQWGTAPAAGVAPQAPCTNPDGTPAKATTPGSTISSYLQANVNSGIGQLVSAQDLDAAIGQVVFALSNRVLGATGLFGSSQPSGSSNTTQAAQTQQNNSAASATASATSALTNVATYTKAFQDIEKSAQIASASLTAYIQAEPSFVAQMASTTICSQQQSVVQTVTANAQAAFAQAQEMLTPAGTIGSVFTSVNTAFESASTTKAIALKVQEEAAVVPIEDPMQFSIDVASLAQMPPGAIDVMNAQSDATATGAATALNWDGTKPAYGAAPAMTLTVSGGTTVDRMNLISANAKGLIASFQTELNTAQSVCSNSYGG
ncbi:MAG: hypothetical protein WCS97_02325 [Candidatus Paceibacterota bacterium]|jgi:hypothetical protein